MTALEIQIAEIVDYTPQMRRVVFAGEAVARYAAHRPCVPNIKIYFPRPGEPIDLPVTDERGRWAFVGDQRSRVRTYTVRWLDEENSRMAIDFVRHGDEGLASAWVERISVGDKLGALGGGGLVLKPGGYAVMFGDETALPAISDTLEHMPAGQTGQVFIEVAAESGIHELAKPEGITVTWLPRGGKPAGSTRLLIQAMENLSVPEGFADMSAVHLWVSAESEVVRFARKWAAMVGIGRANRLIIGYWHRDLNEVAYGKLSDHDRVRDEMDYERPGHEEDHRHDHDHAH
ncbi:siderophore-interacting protein [Glutamicibacter sp. MNS18]|uniref:siderophore-interacting protein n=1 Tax=Glutamicibacter sp. MNS18 TaxID=2989817 RepID=UPI00223677B9|nr:siderophore-interacting protein [Glutamicibacter sp. MNS18]MCW4465898.1 siderophore-interacting protein [Glutamicibacter sp. MNS18]